MFITGGALAYTAAVTGAGLAARRLYRQLTKVPVKDETALVTGSASGIGFLLCVELIERGAAAIIVVDLHQKAVDDAVARLMTFATDIRKLPRIRGYACNVADAAAVKAMAHEVGPVGILINNAGIVSGKSIMQLTEEQIRRTFDVNTLAHFWTTRAFLPAMLKRDKGVIVTISSAGGMVGTNGLTDYSASKFAVYGFDEALRLDLRKQGSKVHTLCVCPFYINTGLFDGVKTKIPLLLPILEADHVARAIVDAIEQRRHYLEIPSLLQLAWITKVLPTSVRDSLLDVLGVTSSMDDFRGKPQSKL